MDQDVFNMSMRKFLKRVGVTSQREIENAVQKALENGSLTGNEKLPITMTLKIDQVELTHVIEDEIKLS